MDKEQAKQSLREAIASDGIMDGDYAFMADPVSDNALAISIMDITYFNRLKSIIQRVDVPFMVSIFLKRSNGERTLLFTKFRYKEASI